jgi:hypothetical protein
MFFVAKFNSSGSIVMATNVGGTAIRSSRGHRRGFIRQSDHRRVIPRLDRFQS